MTTRFPTPSALPYVLTLAASLALPEMAAATDVDELVSQGKFCSATARAEFHACGNDVLDNYWIAFGICINESDSKDRADCFAEAKASKAEDTQLCKDQLAGRREACSELGEHRYDPEFEPKLFNSNFANLTNPNRYFPLGFGNQWEFRSATQSTKVQVLNETKLIDDVHCIVVRDEVREGGALIESTNDWFAQAKDGTVWYCGEETSEFESFTGDRPKNPERVSIDGSFKAGRDGDKPGIIFQANPTPGEFYVEESSLGNAEDATEVLSVNYAFGKDPELDELVPKKLARLLCAGDCVVTRNFSLLEPDVFERKYYAPGIGVFLEVEPESGEVVRLVKCNVDPRCALLP
jgi:hypothetical protein